MTKENSILNMIGILALDIRNNWNCIDNRLDAIIELCEMIGKDEWIQQIEDNIDYIKSDGRWFRGEWCGPFGGVESDVYGEYSHLLSENWYSEDEEIIYDCI